MLVLNHCLGAWMRADWGGVVEILTSFVNRHPTCRLKERCSPPLLEPFLCPISPSGTRVGASFLRSNADDAPNPRPGNPHNNSAPRGIRRRREIAARTGRLVGHSGRRRGVGCGANEVDTVGHRRDVVLVTASARWRGGSRRSSNISQDNLTHWLISTQSSTDHEYH